MGRKAHLSTSLYEVEKRTGVARKVLAEYVERGWIPDAATVNADELEKRVRLLRLLREHMTPREVDAALAAIRMDGAVNVGARGENNMGESLFEEVTRRTDELIQGSGGKLDRMTAQRKLMDSDEQLYARVRSETTTGPGRKFMSGENPTGGTVNGGYPYLDIFIPDENGDDLGPRAKVKFEVPYFRLFLGLPAAIAPGAIIPERFWKDPKFWAEGTSTSYRMAAFKLGLLPADLEIPSVDTTRRVRSQEEIVGQILTLAEEEMKKDPKLSKEAARKLVMDREGGRLHREYSESVTRRGGQSS